MVPLEWGDAISLEVSRSESFECSVDSPGLRVPLKKNLVYRAAESFSRHFKISFSIKIKLTKNIPTGAGLGGGSGNAATILLLLSEWAAKNGVRRSRLKRDLPKLAAKLGADVPFFLLKSAAWCTGFGEKCAPLKVKPLPVVVVMPATKIPTPWAYQTLDSFRARSKENSKLSGCPLWVSGGYSIPLLENDFEALALRFKPQLRRALRLLSISGAQAVRMSGSGSAFYGIYESTTAARKAAAQIRRQGVRAVATMTA